MEEPKQLTDITLVIYPSNHVLKASPKIVLLGKGKEWKDEIVKHTNNYWTETPVMFFYIDDDDYDSDILSWLFLNIKNCNFIIGKLSSDVEDVSLIAPHIKENSTFLVYDNLNSDLQDWFKTINPNRDILTMLSIILKIKEKWHKNGKYNDMEGRIMLENIV